MSATDKFWLWICIIGAAVIWIRYESPSDKERKFQAKLDTARAVSAIRSEANSALTPEQHEQASQDYREEMKAQHSDKW